MNLPVTVNQEQLLDILLNIAGNLNSDAANWKYNEDSEYGRKLDRDFGEIVLSCIDEGIEEGVEIGERILGIPGILVGGVIGAVSGGVRGVFEAVF